MPQRGQPPIRFEPDNATDIGQRGAAPAIRFTPDEPAKPFSLDSILPSAHTVLTTGGGIIGGTLGGMGGTVAGVGVGGVPGAIGGATLGAAGGESLYQIGARLGLFDKSELPSTSKDAAAKIAKEGAVSGALTAAGYGAGKAAGTVLKLVPPPFLNAAEQAFDRVMASAKNVPIDLTEVNKIVDRAVELSQRGHTLPKAVSDYAKNQAASSGMTYEVGRDFGSSASRLSVEEANAIKGEMKKKVAEFAAALKTANRGAAAQVGLGDLYDQAMLKYARAKSIENVSDFIREQLKNAAFSAVMGATGAAVAHKVWDEFH